MPLERFCIGAVLFGMAGVAWSQPAVVDAPPPDAEALLNELKAIQSRQTSNKRQRIDAVKSELIAAARGDNSALRLYADATRQANFAGDAQKFSDWRDRNLNLLTKDKAAGAIARLHLQYLALSLDRAVLPADQPPPFKDLWDYVVAAAEARREYGDQLALPPYEFVRNMLDRPIIESPVAKAKLIQQDLEKLKDWEMNAGAIDGILEKNIRGPLRAAKDPRLIDTWKIQIDYRTKLAEKRGGDVAAATLTQVEIPRLLWSRAKDMVVVGQKNRGILEMTAVIRANPNHPDTPTWISEVTELLQPAPAAEASPTPAAAP